MFGEILQKFAEKSPVTVMVRALLEQVLNPEKLDRGRRGQVLQSST